MRVVEPRRRSRWPILLMAPFVVIGCTGDKGSTSGAAKPAAAAKVENPKPESELTTVTLSDEARKHLAIQTAKVAMEPVRLSRTVGGELIVQPGKSVVESSSPPPSPARCRPAARQTSGSSSAAT
jgi:hypothetical protein